MKNLLSEKREEEVESNRYRLLCELAILQRAKKVQKLKFISRNEAFHCIVLFPIDINLEAANNTEQLKATEKAKRLQRSGKLDQISGRGWLQMVERQMC